jgi:ABC-type uncharacterized transport system permease subunit
MEFWIVQSLNGISFGMLLFLLAAGLSLVFGLMRVVNLTHGSFYLLGAYIGFTLIERTGSFLVALIVAPLCIAVVGLLMHRFLLRRFHQAELAQVLLTFGLLFVFADMTLWKWGGYSQVLPKPAFLATSLTIGTIVFPAYRLFVIATGVVIALLFWLVLERTKLGSLVRAGVDDEPKLLLLDEPTAGLSVAETPLVAALIQHLDPSITVLLIEHDMDVAFQVAQHITVLHQGRLLADGSPEVIRKDPTVAEIYLGVQ